MTLAFSITPNSINVLVEGRMRTLTKSHINFTQVYDLLKSSTPDLVMLKELVDIPAFIAKVSVGRVEVDESGIVQFEGKPLHGALIDRMVTMLIDGFDITPLAKFLDKLQDNPTESAREELYLWIEESNLTITPSGNFLAFKAVNQDYTSCYDGKTDNSIGSQPKMDRSEVDSNRDRTCSSGLHFCGASYLGCYGTNSRVVIVEVNPADVVAIPSDYNNAKGRAWTYKVVGDLHDAGTDFITEQYVVDDYEDDYVDESGDIVETAHPFSYNEYTCVEVDRGFKRPKSFVHPKTGKRIQARHMLARVSEGGQRATAIWYGVARSTLQNWIRKATAE